MRYILFALVLLFSSTSSGMAPGWIDKHGTPIKNTDAMKSINGFGGWLVITSDQNWKEKWDTPETTTPNFKGTEHVKKGEQISILPFFINAKVDRMNNIYLTCDIKISKPNSEILHEQKNIECFKEKQKGTPGNLRLVYSVIDFVAENDDPIGKWVVEYIITDKNSKIKIPLIAHFDLVE